MAFTDVCDNAIYDSRSFRLNKKLLCIIGLWPYDPRKKIIRILWITVAFVLSMPHIIGLIVNFSDMDKFMVNLVTTFMIFGTSLKHFTLAIAENKMKSVYTDIANNWFMITDEEEKQILVEYSKRGRILTIAYLSMVSFFSVIFICLPFVPQILNAINPLPEPRPPGYVLLGEFFVENRNDHFFKIYLWDATTIACIVTISIAIDSMYMVSVEHGSALYAIVQYRLAKLRHRLVSDRQDSTDSSYEWLVHTIKLHQVVLSFMSNINDSYSLCFLCLTIMNIVGLPFTCVIMIIHWHDPVNFIRTGLTFGALMVHLLVLFWPGQKLIDHSTRLLEAAYCNDWYETPLGTKKILRIFMLRCLQPSLITAGGLIEMNLQNYFLVVKTAASYVTVAASFR